MSKDIKTNINRYHCSRFKIKKLTIFLEDGRIDENIFIVLMNENNKYMKISPVSKYFIINMRNTKISTREYHAKLITSFLNFVLIDNYARFKVSRIEDINIEHGNIFIMNLINGKIGAKTKKKESIKKVENILTKFYYFIIYNNKNKDAFFDPLDKKRIKETVFTLKYRDYKSPIRVKNLSFKFLNELMYTCELFCPQLKLAIAFQAFAGLRCGEVCNITSDIVNIKYINNKYYSFCVDLREKKKIRDDNIDCGSIKKMRTQYVHPIFLSEFQCIYENHMKKYFKENKYGALFLNRGGKAMTKTSYSKKFIRMINLTIERIALNGNVSLLGESNNLISNRCSTHVLRHFFSKYLIKSGAVTTAAELASWRGDTSLESAIIYLADSQEINNRILKIQEDNYEELK